jgi:hypothetical protein
MNKEKIEMYKEGDFLVHQSFRYCMGRRTYAIKNFCDWAEKYWKEFSIRDKELIERELKEELDRAEKFPDFGWLGSKYDVQTWKDLYNFIIDNK